MNYDEYIQSKEWQIRRQWMLIKHGEKCSLCPRTYELQVHHLNYERLGHERTEDVIVLCVRCHNDLHYALRQFPATERAVRQYEKVSLEKYIQAKHKAEDEAKAKKDKESNMPVRIGEFIDI